MKRKADQPKHTSLPDNTFNLHLPKMAMSTSSNSPTQNNKQSHVSTDSVENKGAQSIMEAVTTPNLPQRILVKTKEYDEADHRDPIKIHGMSIEEIDSLHETDPFLYYSIQSKQRRFQSTFFDAIVDHGVVHETVVPSRRCRRGTQQKRARITRISRRTAISAESHQHLLLEEFLNGGH